MELREDRRLCSLWRESVNMIVVLSIFIVRVDLDQAVPYRSQSVIRQVLHTGNPLKKRIFTNFE